MVERKMSFKRKLPIIYIVLILCLSLFGFTNNSLPKVKAIDLEIESKVIEEDKIELEQKVFSKATIDEDFADDSVIVVFKKSTSDYSKIFTTKDFTEVKCKSINDITKYKRMLIADKKAEKIAMLEKTRGLSADKIEISDKEIIEEYNIDVENFQNMICLKLEEKGKEKVLEAIKILEKREDNRYK